MSQDFRARGMRAALKRLEKSVGKGQRHCPWCRVNFRHWWPDPNLPMPSPEALVKYRCWVCGTDMVFNFADLPDDEREVLRLNYSFSMEDTYTNPVAIALEIWLLIYPIKGKSKGTLKSAVNNDDDDLGARTLARLNEEADALLGRKRSRLEARYGDPSLKVKDIIASVQKAVIEKWQSHLGIRGLPELAQEQKVYLICAELEKIVWGQVRPQTASLPEESGERIDHLVADEKERLRLNADENALREKVEAEARARTEEEREWRPQTADNQSM